MSDNTTIPPHSIETEQALLGAIFLEPDCLADVANVIKSEDMFFRDLHRCIYRAIVCLSAESKEIDWVTVVSRVESNGDADRCGGVENVSNYVREISMSVPSSGGVTEYAETVRDRWVLRKVIELGSEIKHLALNPAEKPSSIIGAARARIDDISDGCVTVEPVAIEDAVREAGAEARAGGIVGQSVGIPSLDAIMNGMRGGQLIVIGGRPGQGKSALALQIAESHQRRKDGVFFASLEMSKRELAERLVSQRSGVDSLRYRHWKLGQGDMEMALAAERSLSGYMWIDDTSCMSAEDIAMKARRLHNRYGLRLVIVDYVQLVKSNPRMERHLQIGESTRRFKSLARELDVPVIVAAQLNRESSKEKRSPTLADLRESGSIEQDADQVLLIHWLPDGDYGDAAKVEIIVAKNRSGQVGRVHLEYRKAQTRFCPEAPVFGTAT